MLRRIINPISLLLFLAILMTACQPSQLVLQPESGMEDIAAESAETDQKIENALSAAPPAIAEIAMVVDWPTEPGAEQATLREGDAAWVCMPDWPATPPNDPMCLDPTWSDWMAAFMAGEEPPTETFGVSYMLAGGAAASNTDPFAMQPADGEEWVVPPPHVMFLMPGGFDAEIYGTDYTTGEPWIMWDETPYEFLVVPTTAAVSPNGPIDVTESAERKIENVTSAATQVVAEGATILDWPTEAGGEMALLREGNNSWTCVPDWPATPDDDPMCFDPTYMAWMASFMGGEEPQVDVLGVSYMLAGGAAASNTDPSLMVPPDGEEWVVPAPHVMLVAPDGFDSAVFSTDHTWGGPWIMWDETPYEFLVVPIE